MSLHFLIVTVHNDAGTGPLLDVGHVTVTLVHVPDNIVTHLSCQNLLLDKSSGKLAEVTPISSEQDNLNTMHLTSIGCTLVGYYCVLHKLLFQIRFNDVASCFTCMLIQNSSADDSVRDLASCADLDVGIACS